MIPEAAVAAAIEAAKEVFDGKPPRGTRMAIAAALEAAAPHILAEGLAEAAQQMRDERHTWCLDDVGRYWIKRTLDELAERADNMRPTP